MYMNEIKVFENEEFGKVRTVSINNEAWFVGKDVAEILGYSNTRKAIADHVDDEDKKDGVTIRDAIGRNQSAVAINESGLYSLILSSKLPNAKKFKHWVTSEVLPQIRKTGGYVANDDMFLQNYLPFADEQTKLFFKATLTTMKRLNDKIEQDAPKVELYDRLMDADGYVSFNVAAKELGMGRNTLMGLLRDKGILFKDGNSVIAYQRYCNSGYFVVKHFVNQYGRHCGTTKVTPKGLEWLYSLLKEENALAVAK
nr:MAG TPA: repressor domain protein [Caudoviricetes sp.]